MNYLDVLICPWNTFLDRSLYRNSIICLILQMTMIGWLPASLWAVLLITSSKRKTKKNMYYPTVDHDI